MDNKRKDSSLKDKGDKITIHYLVKIFESLPGRAYIKDKNGVYLMCNAQLAEDSGFSSPSELIGKTDYDLPSKGQADILREVDCQVMEKAEPITLDEPGTHADGSPAIYHTRKIPLRDEHNNIQGIFGLSTDITKEKQIEVMKNTREHFYWKSREGVYLDCNDAVAKAAGFQSARELIGKTDHDILSKKEADILCATDLRIMNSGLPEILEEPGLRNDGSLGVFLTSKFPLHDMSGNISSIMGFSTDITAQKHAEMSKADFISNMEHDLRTPFAGISGITTMLCEMETDPTKKEMLDLLVKSCSQWEKTHQHILAVLSTKEPTVVKPEWFSINEELVELQDMLGATVRLKNLNFTFKGVPQSLDKINTDRLKFRLILSSLIGNAVNFTDKGTVEIIVSYEESQFNIQITDTGIGIPEDKLDFIFEPFTKLSRSNKHGSNFKGVGLGLYVSRQMAAQLGGYISVKSKLGKGSTFTLTLPIQNNNWK